MATFFLALFAVMVGFFCGCTSVGGILLIPAIVVFSALGMHQAMATALFSFALMAVLGTWLHHRKGSIDWMQAIPLCFGAFLFGFIGAKANMYLSPVWLKYILAVQIIFAGLNVLRPLQKSCFNVTNCPMNVQRLALFLLGGFAGFMAGLTGIGGPVISVPFMISMGFPPLYSVAMAQPFQGVACTSGSIANMLSGSIDYGMAAWITALELIGFYVGIIAAYRMNAQRLKTIIAYLCIVTGGYLLLGNM